MLSFSESITISTHLGAALVAGGLIGLERSYHGRDAGFRTHVLVALSSALLMLVTIYQSKWFPETGALKITSDPTRMAQGIMTGIGFLGAGVIMKDGLSVKGLTTAASIWITASIGILAGIGFYEPVVLATALTLAALGVFRWLEAVIPSYRYLVHRISFVSGQEPSEAVLEQMLKTHGFLSYKPKVHFDRQNGTIEFEMTLRTKNLANVDQLSKTWQAYEGLRNFSINPT
jgi:putative Mg2+ transporter-C (MgtC) family protein